MEECIDNSCSIGKDMMTRLGWTKPIRIVEIYYKILVAIEQTGTDSKPLNRMKKSLQISRDRNEGGDTYARWLHRMVERAYMYDECRITEFLIATDRPIKGRQFQAKRRMKKKMILNGMVIGASQA